MIYTPLTVGQIIYPPEDAYDKVYSVVRKNNKEMLARGLLCEYAHNHQFDLAGLSYETTHTEDVFDRKFNGMLQDDKLATLDDHDKRSSTHTISARENKVWPDFILLNGADVILQSFEEIANNGSRYCGAISFKLLLKSGLIKPSKFNDSFFFDRFKALQQCAAT